MSPPFVPAASRWAADDDAAGARAVQPHVRLALTPSHSPARSATRLYGPAASGPLACRPLAGCSSPWFRARGADHNRAGRQESRLWTARYPRDRSCGVHLRRYRQRPWRTGLDAPEQALRMHMTRARVRSGATRHARQRRTASDLLPSVILSRAAVAPGASARARSAPSPRRPAARPVLRAERRRRSGPRGT